MNSGERRLAKWKYNPNKKVLTQTINQTQDFLFQFPLQLAIQGGDHTIFKPIDISNRITNITLLLNFKPKSILLDPDVNLLFEGYIAEEK